MPATPSESDAIFSRLKERLRLVEDDAIALFLKERRESADAGAEPITLTRTFRDPAAASREPWGSFGLLKAANPVNGRSYYYLTGEKLYFLGLKSNPSCKVNVSFEGVVTTAADGVLTEKVSAHAYAEYCGDAASWMEALATLRLRDRRFWIVQLGVEDGYDYGLFDPDANGLVNLKGEWALRRR